MAFIVEDGTGVPNANSYASVATADAYFAEVGNAQWAAGQTVAKQNALVRASRYIRQRWGSRIVLVLGPGLVLPEALVAATCEYALRTLDGTELVPELPQGQSGFSTFMSKKQIGPITKEYKLVGTDTSTPSAYRSYPIPDAMIATLFASSTSAGQLSIIR